MKLLREEISVKNSKVEISEKDLIRLERKLRETLCIIDYTDICCLYLNNNDDRKLEHQPDIYTKKLCDLGFENSQISRDPGKVIFNYSSHILTESVKGYFARV